MRAFEQARLEARLEQVRVVADRVAASSGAITELIPRPEDGAPPFPPADKGRCLMIAAAAADEVGIAIDRRRCMATLEANLLHGMGLPTLEIASGGRGPHSALESIPADELDRLVALLGAILSHAGESDTG